MKWASRRLGLVLALLAWPIAMVAVLRSTPSLPSARWEEFHPHHSNWSNGELPTRIAFSPDGRTILTNNSHARLRDATTARVIAELAKVGDAAPPIPRFALRYPTFFDDGRLLVAEVGGSPLDPPGALTSLKVWDVASGRERASFPDLGHRWEGPKFVVSANGKTLAFSQGPPPQPGWIVKRLRAWTPSLGLLPHEFKGAECVPFALSPDGSQLLGVELDGPSTITRYDVATGRELGTVAHDASDRPAEMAFAPDGRLLCWYHFGGTSEILDLESGRRQILPKSPISLASPVRFAADGKLLLLGDLRKNYETLEICDLAAGRISDVSHEGFDSISADGRRMAAIDRKRHRNTFEAPDTRNDSVVIVTDQPGGGERGRLVASGVTQTQFSPDASRLAIRESRSERSDWDRWLRMIPFVRGALPSSGSESSEVDQITILDVDSWRTIATIPLPGLEPGEVGLAFSPDRKQIAVEYPITEGGASGPVTWAVEVWDLPTPRPWWRAVGISSACSLFVYLVGRRFAARSRRLAMERSPA
jgi:hypothetical protein